MTERTVRKSTKLLLFAAGSMAVIVSVALETQIRAQSQEAAGSSFAVASVRSVPAGRGYTSISPSGAANFTATNVSMAVLIEMAFGVNADQLSGKPSWLESELYDVVAKPEDERGLSYEQLKPPLQRLLSQRFQLAVHRERKEVSGYALVVAKGGPRLYAGKATPTSGYILRDGLRSPNASMLTLAGMLAIPAGRPVVDKTGIVGNYDVTIKFAPDGDIDSSLPSLFTAVREQLGLKLEPQKVSIEMLVIDHVEKMPSEN